MTFVPLLPTRHVSQLDRLSTQIGVARELALNGNGGPARKICGSVFLDHAMLLMRDEALLTAYVECLLLLEMTALLPRVFQAVYGMTLDMVPLTGTGAWRWRVTLGNGVTLALSSPGPRADQNTREQAAARSAATILAAAQEQAGETMLGLAPYRANRLQPELAG